ncbi:hypothetical protein HN680_03995 [Candidatus Peregrinibacteria bacterium]|nr:hypothetical protein [Candidatus Peregrinibacteria bacterium]
MSTSAIIMSLIFLAIVFIVLAFIFYNRASKEIAFVRTGFGGEKIIKSGGAIVIPGLHEVIGVNMNTMRLEVQLTSEQSVITKDRMRVDIVVDFYVHVAPNIEALSVAASTLGTRTRDAAALSDIVEGKFVDVIRSTAAEMTMEELHEKRKAFITRVREAVEDDLTRNGLELEAASLTQLDQTDMSFFNPSNAFDAEGLTRLTEKIESRKKKRNDIEQDTQIQIRNKNLETEKLGLTIEREEHYARLEQQLEVESRKAEQMSEISSRRAEKSQEADQAEIVAKQKVAIAKIISQREIEQEQLDCERSIKEHEIEKGVIQYLAENVRNNVRELEGALNRIIGHHQLNNSNITLDSTKQIMENISASNVRGNITPKKIIQIVSSYFDISIEEITGNCRRRQLVTPRQIVMYLMREEIKASYPSIGQELGGRDHTTAIHACNKITAILEKDEKMKNDIHLIKQKFYQ